MPNLIKNGTFTASLAGWEVVDGPHAAMKPRYAGGDGSPAPGCMFMSFENYAWQTLIAELAGQYKLSFKAKTPDTSAGEAILIAKWVAATTEEAGLRLTLPYSDELWHDEEVTIVIDEEDIGSCEISFETDYDLRAGVFIDTVAFEYLDTEPHDRWVRELAARRNDVLYMKHAKERYAQLFARAINESPRTLWHPTTVEVATFSGTQRYGLYHLSGLDNSSQVERVWRRFATGQVGEIGRWECIDVEAGTYIYLDESVSDDGSLFIEYRPAPEYVYGQAGEVPIDVDWALAHAMTLLLAEAGNDVEPEARRLTDLQYWEGRKMSLEAQRGLRPSSAVVRTMPTSWYVTARPDDAEIEVEPPIAEFVASPVAGGRPLVVTFSDLSQGPITSWSWDFGDGQVSDERNPVHTYVSNGVYNPALTVTGPGGSSSSIQVIKVGVPVAAFHVADDQLVGIRPHTVDFINDTVETGIDNISYLWTFNVGAPLLYTSEERNPSHTYESVGTYTVQLEVIGPTDSSIRVRTDYIKVGAQIPLPEVSLTVVPSIAATSESVTLSATIVGAISWYWLIEDPDTPSGTARFDNILTVNYVWSTAGQYDIQIVATNSAGVSSPFLFANAVRVEEAAKPIVDFVASKTVVKVGEYVQFTNLTQNLDPTDNWDWDFGDGGAGSTEYEPSYAWDTADTYTVELTGDDGVNYDTETKVGYIEVQDITPPPTGRVAGAIATYYFNEAGGVTVYDAESSPVDLTLSGSYARNTEYAFVQFTGGNAQSAAAFAKFVNAAITSDAYTAEAWLMPSSAVPTSTVRKRIVSVGASDASYDVELCQVGDNLRAYSLDSVTTYMMETLSISPNTLYHLVFTRDDTGAYSIYWNKTLGEAMTEQTGDLSTWDNTDILTVADWAAEGRAFDGRVYLVAFYDKALTQAEVNQNFEAGPGEDIEPPPVLLDASFVATPTSGVVPLSVQFTDTSEGEPDSWAWLFGDGETSLLQNPSHEYTEVGQYTVRLTVADFSGTTPIYDSTEQTITVSSDVGPTGEDEITVVSLPFPRAATAGYTPTKYVDGTSGDDNDDGSQANPWKTLTKAGNAAEAGDVVLVLGDTYTAGLVVQNNGTEANPIIFLGDGALGNVTIDMSNENEAIDISDRSWVLVENFEVAWDGSFDSCPVRANDARKCTLRKIKVDTGKTAEQADNLSTSSRGLVTYGSEYCWYDQIHIEGMKIGASFGDLGGYNYISYCRFKDSGRHSATFNDSGVSGGKYVNENYAYNTLFYRCWFDYTWKADNMQHVGDEAVAENASYHYTRIIYKQCVFFGGAENALDTKDSRKIYADECMFYGGVGSDGRGVTFDEWAPTWTVGAGSGAQELTMRRCILWDNTVGPRTFWDGFVAAHNTMVHLNRNLNGAGQTSMASGRIVGFQGFGHKSAGPDQLIVNNVVWDQLGVHASWSDGADPSRIDGNVYGQNSGGDGVSWGKVDESANSWDEESTFADWQDWLDSCNADGADADGFVLSGDPFQDVEDYPDYETDGDHQTGWDFRPVTGGELIGVAVPVTTTTNSGSTSTTAVTVENPHPFTDGFGIMVSDYIRIAGKERVKVVSINYTTKTITIQNPGITWSQGDRVDFDYPNAYGPTIGALQPNSEKWWEKVT